MNFLNFIKDLFDSIVLQPRPEIDDSKIPKPRRLKISKCKGHTTLNKLMKGSVIIEGKVSNFKELIFKVMTQRIKLAARRDLVRYICDQFEIQNKIRVTFDMNDLRALHYKLHPNDAKRSQLLDSTKIEAVPVRPKPMW